MARLADRIYRKVRIEITAGIASVPEDAVTVAELINFADTALQFALNTSQTVVPAARLRENVEEQPETEALDERQVQNVEKETLNEPLGRDEWLLEFLDFKAMNALMDLEKTITSIGNIKDFQFISLDDTRLTVKINSSEQDLAKKLELIPQFTIKGVDADKHIIRLLMGSEG
jgi:predicted signal transduction protein with EAL and GGDEF domain